jgi:hypothetical protein
MKAMRFIRTVTVAAAILVLPTASADGQIKLGIIGGVNFASVNDVDIGALTETFDNRSGFHLGAFLEFGSPAFALRPGILYLNAGSLFEGATFLNQDAFTMSFVSFPLDLRARFGVVDVFAGPEFQYLVSADAEDEFDDDLRSWVINGGVGVGLRLGPFMPEVRYLFALTGLTESDFTVGGVSVTTDGQRTQALRASVGLAF